MYSSDSQPEDLSAQTNLMLSTSRPDDRRKKRRKDRKLYTFAHYEPVNQEGQIRLLKLFPSDHEKFQDDYQGMPNILCELVITTLRKNENNHIPYEALSWCWGAPDATWYINIRKKGKIYAKYVRPDLVYALHALRHHQMDRYIWIDAICINQENTKEKNHQIEMMAEIYGRARQVCVWLGVATKSSQIALRFIKKEVLQLRHFDELCRSRQASEKWKALLELMQRPWFSRRWVVQEIALAQQAVIYCGSDRISWQKFAVAVELFVEVETATHRLSEVMKKDPKFFHVPGWFEYVSALGASLLVEATGRLFRNNKVNHVLDLEPGLDPQTESEPESGSEADLVSDAESESEPEEITVEKNLNSVQYRAQSPDPGRLPHLDDEVDPEGNLTGRSSDDADDSPDTERLKGQPLLSLEYLVSSLSSFDTTVEHDNIYALLAISRDTTPKAADKALHVTDHSRAALENFTETKDYRVDYGLPYVDVCQDFIQFCVQQAMRNDPSRALDVICRPWATEEKILVRRRRMRALEWERNKASEKKAARRVNAPLSIPVQSSPDVTEGMFTERAKRFDEMPLPSWVPQLSNAPFAMDYKAGVEGSSMVRMNADPLVGMPSLTQRSYYTAESKKLNLKIFRFRKREERNYYSMFVEGFILDTVADVQQCSQGGSIPTEWADFGGWRDAKGKPPDEFWRTLVADRGKDSKNPPVYYARACKESFTKGSIRSGAISTTDLINNERNSVVAQFCRRVQSVIWNRALIKTEHGALGLVGKPTEKGDKICIIYGCSVPIVLRRSAPKTEETIEEEIECELAHLQSFIKKCFDKYRERVRLYDKQRRMDQFQVDVWKTHKWLAFRSHESWRKGWKSNLEQGTLQVEDDDRYRRGVEFNTWLREKGKKITFENPKKMAEKWKKGWAPPKVDWEEFRLFLKYGRFWLRLIKKQKAAIQKEAEEYKKRLEERERERKGRCWHHACTNGNQSGILTNSVQSHVSEAAAESGSTTLNNPFAISQEPEISPAANPYSIDELIRNGELDNESTSWRPGEQDRDDLTQTPNVMGHTDSHAQAPTEPSGSRNPSRGGAPSTIEPPVDQDSSVVSETKASANGTQSKEPHLTAEQSQRLTPDERRQFDRKVREKYRRTLSEDFRFHYRMMGECYVHGMMDGEAMAVQNQKKADYPVHVFEIR